MGKVKDRLRHSAERIEVFRHGEDAPELGGPDGWLEGVEAGSRRWLHKRAVYLGPESDWGKSGRNTNRRACRGSTRILSNRTVDKSAPSTQHAPWS